MKSKNEMGYLIESVWQRAMMPHFFSKFIADHLTKKIMYWAIIRAFTYTSTHECSHKHPDEIGYADLMRSWGKKSGME